MESTSNFKAIEAKTHSADIVAIAKGVKSTTFVILSVNCCMRLNNYVLTKSKREKHGFDYVFLRLSGGDPIVD